MITQTVHHLTEVFRFFSGGENGWLCSSLSFVGLPMWELKKARGMQETHQLHIWGMVYCGSSWALRTYDVPSSAAGLSWIIGVSCALQGRSHTKYKKQYCIKGTASVLCRCEVKSLPISNLRVERVRAWTGVLKKNLSIMFWSWVVLCWSNFSYSH